jgi:Domain of unknown function (DUF6894)
MVALLYFIVAVLVSPSKSKSRIEAAITDVDGTDLADIDAAREHADTVARELTFKTTGILGEEWSKWTMIVYDGAGLELFSFGMSTVRYGNGK